MSYNGWTNYETWLANLWLSSNQADYERYEKEARIACLHCIDDGAVDRDDATRCLADVLKMDFQDGMDELGLGDNGFWLDLLNSAFSEIDWHEIAEHFIGDAADEVDAELVG